MAHVIDLNQPNCSRAIYDNGTLILEKRTGGTIRHANVPWSVINGLECSGNPDSYYESQIKYNYPMF